MPWQNSLMHVGYWVTDLAALSCLGAGLAAIILTLLPGKRLTGKSEGVDPSAFIDPGAGETARYRLAYKDLVSVKNSSLDVTQVSTLKAADLPAAGAAADQSARVQSASDLALTMFDQGVVGLGLGARSQEATKQLSKTKIDAKTKIDSKTKIEPKTKPDSKTKIESKPKVDAKAKPKVEPKKGDAKAKVETNMAVRKITYGAKAVTHLPTAPVDNPSTGAPHLVDYFQDEPAIAPAPQGVDATETSYEVVPGDFAHEPEAQAPIQPQPIEPEPIDPKRDPKKVGRSTLIEPKRNLQADQEPSSQSDREPPPLEYFQ